MSKVEWESPAMTYGVPMIYIQGWIPNQTPQIFDSWTTSTPVLVDFETKLFNYEY
jgi:hypothetical protein